MTSKENLIRFYRRQAYDHVPRGIRFMDVGEELDYPIIDGMASMGVEGAVQIDPPACERPMFGDGYDVFGVHWLGTEGISHYDIFQKPRYEDIEDWRDQVKFPDVNRLDWDTFRRRADELDTENNLVCCTLLAGCFERGTMLTSMENCLMDIISDPENYAGLMHAVADYKIALIDKMCEYVPLGLITYHDDWGTAKSTFMSVDLWRETIKPATRRIYDCMKRHGIIIHQHSCGSVGPLIPDMIEMGASMWDAQKASNDLARLSRLYGDKLCITANDIGAENAAPPAPDEDFGEAGGPPPWLNPYPAYNEIPEFLFR